MPEVTQLAGSRGAGFEFSHSAPEFMLCTLPGTLGKGSSATKRLQEEMTYLLGCDVNISRNDPLNCGSHFTTRRRSYSDAAEEGGWKEQRISRSTVEPQNLSALAVALPRGIWWNDILLILLGLMVLLR